MNFLVKDKHFYTALLAMALPIALQNLITIGISMMDTVMLGRLGEVQMTAVSLANQVFFIFNSFMFGLGSGSNVLIAQYWGKKDIVQIRKIMALNYRAVLLLGVAFGAIALFLPAQVMSIFSKDAAVIAEGISYLRIIGFAYMFHGLTVSTTFTLRAFGAVRIAVLISTISLITNVSLNWIFIFGNLGAPALGVAGAAIATVIAKIVEFVIIILYSLHYERDIHFSVADLLSKDKSATPDYVANVMPVLVNEMLWGLGATTITMIIGRLGTQFAAAASICTVVTQFVSVGIIGVANATGILTGHTIGKGEYEKTKQQANTVIVLSVLMGILSCGAMLITRPIIIDYYNISAVAKDYAFQIMGVASVMVIFQSVSIITMMGVLRGGGDSKFVLFADVFFLWVVAIPIGFLCGHVWGLPVALVYTVLKSDEVLKSVFCSIRVLRGNWLRDLTI